MGPHSVDPGNARVPGDQTGDAQPGANVDTARSRGVDEQRVERDAPNTQAGL